MSCESIREQLIDYHYGEIAAEARTVVATHLGGCAECALEYCRLHADLSGISVLEEPRPHVLQNLKREVRAKSARPSFLSRWLKIRVPLYQPALIALSALAVWFVVSDGPLLLDSRNATPEVDNYDARATPGIDLNLL